MTTPTLIERIQARDGVAVVLFTKNQCSQCDLTKRILDREHVSYTAVNVEEDPTAYQYVTATLNLRQMPVVIASTPGGDVVWSGLQPGKIRDHITDRKDVA